MVKRLLKKSCVLVGLGLVFLSSIFILLDLSLLSTLQRSVTSQTMKIQQLQQFKRTAAKRNFRPEENFHTSREETNDKHHQETNALGRSQIPQIRNCVQRDEEASCFYEILLGSVVYSAFLDNRLKDQAFIRVISILPSYGEQIQMYCHFQDQETEEQFTRVMEVEELGKSQGFSYLGFLGSCDIPEQIETTLLCSVNISLQPEAHLQTTKNTKVIPLHVANHGENTVAYHLCVTPMAGEISVARLVEFIELSQILGVSHFTFYNVKGTDRGILEVLKYYKYKGVVTVLPWDLPYYMSANIFKLGRAAAINDCLYRSLGKFAFVVVNAIDEYLLPVGEYKVLQMLQRIHDEDIAGHCFESYSINTNYSQNSQTPLITQRFKFRARAPNSELYRCIVSPINIFFLDLNTLPNPLEEFYTIRQVEPTIGYVIRYTKCGENGEECAETQEDQTMEKYREELGTRFKGIMRQLRIQKMA